MFRKAMAVAALLLTCENAFAGNLLRRAGGLPSPGASAAQAAAQAAAAAAAAREATGSLRRARESIEAFRAAQEAARTAAQAGQSPVANGLGPGAAGGLPGLQVAPGVDVDPSLWQGAGRPTESVADGRTVVTVEQDEQKAILTWETFNVGRETELHFDQRAGGDRAGEWIALNRVIDPSAAPSRILGSIRAEGQVYVINRNGVIFGGTSQVNVGTLIGSAMDFVGADYEHRAFDAANAFFREGVLSSGGLATVFQGQPGEAPGDVTVDRGARIQVAGYGQAALFGKRVSNGGTIEAPDGQVVLGAGEAVALAKDAGMRGYRVVPAGGGTAENTGILSSPRGNITVAGSEVVQGGLATATTGAEARGSILLGSDGAGFTTTLAPGSVTQILPDEGGEKVVGEGVFEPSLVDVVGGDIRFLGGSTVYVPGGTVRAGLAERIANADPAAIAPDDVRIYLDAGALIDVSGLRDVDAPMEQNNIRGELRASELADNPALRDGPLRGETVWFDARLGVGDPTDPGRPGIANLSGYYDLVERDVAQLMTRGGTVELIGGEVVLRQGSIVDLSGGSIRYRDGYLTSTQLVDQSGRRVRIEDAVAGERYVGLAGTSIVNHERWGVTESFRSGLNRARPRFEAGYVEGRSAGTLRLDANGVPNRGTSTEPTPDDTPTAPFRVLEGDVVADLAVGPNQRALPGSTDPRRAWTERPRGATLVLDRAGDVVVADVPSELPAAFQPGDALPEELRYRHVLPARWLDGTFSSVGITSGYTDDRTNGSPATANLARGGTLTISRGVTIDLGDAGSFSFTGKGAEIDGTLLAPGGSVRIDALDAPGAAEPLTEVSRIRLGETGVIDVAGRFTNETLGDGPRRALDGGTVRLDGLNVVLEQGSLVDVSSGARLEASGTKVTGGTGGSIAIDVSRYPRPVDGFARDGSLVLGGTLAGYGVRSGGSLSLSTADDLVIGAALPAGAGSTSRLLDPELFTRGGFSAYSLRGERSVTVQAGTLLAPSAELLVLPGAAAELPGGTRLTDVAERRLLPAGQRAPMTLSLSAGPDVLDPTSGATMDLVVAEGAEIRMDPGSKVKLSSVDLLRVDGRISAPGGSIELSATETGAATLPIGVPRIVVGSTAELLAPGYVKTTVDGPMVRRSVERGGTISLTVSGLGTTSHEGVDDLRIEAGSVLDVSGTKGLADLIEAPALEGERSRYQEAWVEGDAGRIAVGSSYGGLVAGTLRLAPGGEKADGGSLEITSAPSAPIVLGDGIEGRARALAVDTRVLGAAGADDLLLSGIIRFEGDVSLHTRRSLTLETPQLGTVPETPASSIALSSRHVAFDGGALVGSPTFDGTTPSSQLSVEAELIDFSDTLWLGCPDGTCGGFASARFDAAGDIRLSARNVPAANLVSAGIFSPGAIELDAAQVYVTSRVRGSSMERAEADPGFLVLSGAGIEVKGNGAPAPVPLSFGERLTLRAPTIVQGGVLRAPQGQLRLEGTGPEGSVTLLPGSLTSASLEGLTVLYGDIERQGFVGYGTPGQAPTKSIALDAADLDVQAGATVDVSGGGDLMGYAFLEGNGGSRDVLGAAGSFAILPGAVGGGFAPLDGTSELSDSTLRVGDAVFLQGVPGLADGTYTVLPAHYALLPGGLLVRPLANPVGTFLGSAPETTVRPDGAVIAAGRRTVAGTTIQDPGWSRFAVMDRETFGGYSELVTTSFDEYARDLAAEAGRVVRTPADAGTVVLEATRDLQLRGAGRFGVLEEGALLGNLDVSAQRIAVVAPGGADREGYLTLDVDALGAFGAGSVLVGGTRAAGVDGTTLTVNAVEVAVDTGGAAWVGPEILLAARTEVSVADGSILRAEGAVSRDTNPLRLAGDGALLRLSTGDRVGIVRSGTPGLEGVLDVGGATLASPGSLTLDGSRSLGLSPAVALQARQLDLASSRILLGDAPADAPGTRLGVDLVASLGASADLLLRGHESIQLHGGAGGAPLVIGGREASGGKTLTRITLDTGLLQGSGAAVIDAGELTLRNSGGAAGTGATGAGTLDLDVDALALGPGELRIVGYRALQGRAGVIEARSSGTLALDGDLSLRAGRMTAGSGVRYAIDVTVGDISLAGDPRAVQRAAPTSLGGRLELTAASIDLDTAVLLPAGTFQATATGGSLRVGQGGVIDVTGVERAFGELAEYAPGGAIRLSASGDLVIAAGAALDVSGAEGGGDAGRVELLAGGSATLDGQLRGAAGAGSRGGSFSLDAGTLGSFTALNRGIEAGGFDEAREIRLRQQGIALESEETLTAHRVMLRSDTAGVTIAGTVDAAGTQVRPDGGRIELVAAGDVLLAGTASIDARAGQAPEGAFEPSSGTLALVSSGGRVDVASGATIDLSGGKQGGGTVIIRAPRTDNDLAVSGLAGEFRGARELLLQGLQRYDGRTVVDDALVGAMLSDASAWLAAGPDAIRARLGASAWQVAPAMLVTSDGDLAIAADVDLHGLASPGHLGFQARGDIAIGPGVDLSDGFDGVAREAALLDRRSFGLGFESGGDLTLAPDAMVRTGTGDLVVRAGGDLLLQGTRSVIYTAGQRTATEQGFSAPSRADGSARPLGEFPTDGGDITLDVAGDIEAALPTQTTSAWLFRYGGPAQQTSWSVVYGNFEQGVGALGGGDVRVSAGGDVVQLDVAIPTTGHVTAPMGELAEEARLAIRDHRQVPSLALRGGGDLELRAGGDVRGGLFMLGRGQAEVSAGGAIAGSQVAVGSRSSYGSPVLGPDQQVGVLFGLMDATARVTAASNVEIQAAFDPARQGQIAQNLDGDAGSAFWGYTERTELEATSLAGEVRYANDPWASVDPSTRSGLDPRWRVVMAGNSRTDLNSMFGYAPPSLRFTSFESRVPLFHRFGSTVPLRLDSAAAGTLELLAGTDVRIGYGVQMDDVAPEHRRGPLSPVTVAVTLGRTGSTSWEAATEENNYLRGELPIHLGDPSAARIYAVAGSVCAFLNGTCFRDPAGTGSTGPQAVISFPKPLEVFAGVDVVAGDYQPQNNEASDLSWIRAGRDVRDVGLQVMGPGTAVLAAGRDVVLTPINQNVTGLGGGLGYAKGDNVKPSATIPNRNTALPSGDAADLHIMAGAADGVDYQAFAAAYLDPANRQEVVRTYLPELAEYMEGLLGLGPASDVQLVAAFQALPEMRRRIFLERIYFNELRETGIDYNDPESDRYQSYERGFRAVKLLFPTDPAGLPAEGGGDVLLNGKPVETQALGDITILAPYGRVLVGTPSLNTSAKESGVVTRRGGDIRIMAEGNIDLETSRVFTLQGGDITMWTSSGSITAGTGSKTSVFQTPIQYEMSNDAIVTVNAFGISTGAGIGVLDALQDGEDRERSRLDLIAPTGEVNAGDAGIRVVGDLNIAAAVVVGMENIQVSGASAGVPTVEVPNVAALTTASELAQAAAQEGGVGPQAQPRNTVAELPSIITVEVVGYETTEQGGARDEGEEARKRRTKEKAGEAR